MTVSSTTVKNSYSGNGSTTQFAYGYKIFADSDLIVIIRTDSTGAETVKTLTTHYTVSGAGDASGGNVTFTSGNTPASGQTVVIIREVPQTQAIDYIANDPFPAESHEEGLDRGTMTTQQVQEELNRAIKLSRTNTMTSTEFTVGATDRANKVLAFDSSGEISVTQELGTFKGNSATTTTAAFVQRDIVKATTTAQLNNIYICVADSAIGDTLTDTDHFALLVDAVSAATSATAAANSASAAATSETNAATSATNAATSESNASTSATTASTQATNASTSATNAATSESNASTSETNAATSATTATTQATNASNSATTATTQATNASTSATNAATSETNAATSATTATTKASEASTSATNAGTSETNASNSASAAATSAAEAAASADAFDDVYLGSKSSDPTVDNDGDPLAAGMLYYNTVSNIMRIYSGSAWENVAVSTSGFATLAGIETLTNKTLTSAQLGGDLDTNGNDINFADNDRARFGDSGDLQIYHSGNESYIRDTGTGVLYIDTNGSQIDLISDGSVSNGKMARFVKDGAVELYHDNSKKFETTSTGVDITGTAVTDGLTVAGNVNLGDNDRVYFGTGNDLEIYHDGSNSYIKETGTGNLGIQSNGTEIQISKTPFEHMIRAIPDGAVKLYHNNLEKLETTSSGIDVTGTLLADKGYIAETTLTDGATISWDMNTQSVAKVTLGGNRTIAAPTNGSTGQFASLLVAQDGTGGRTLTWNAVYEFASDTAPTLTTTASLGDLFVFRYNGSKWLEVGRNLALTLS